ncbi:hypothetical protein K435DRAFT_473256 [Dendrothele bispora CBS 962.96]|uniref:Uncharacterized protein n=1 Tax=Dendrothele bispora (strain CBS 962.96) TaxID=1314807 RepID=A0A4S8MBR1_DENBC|nr:hypothetical protein K435DRAFT_473256 [Dendrothele bispora CBS 962.96]
MQDNAPLEWSFCTHNAHISHTTLLSPHGKYVGAQTEIFWRCVLRLCGGTLSIYNFLHYCVVVKVALTFGISFCLLHTPLMDQLLLDLRLKL